MNVRDERPNPDKLLADLKSTSSQRGFLKIYLGMSAGVGKTFAMLSDALIEKNRGMDVVAGYIEPHGREETESLANNFECIQPLLLDHRGIQVREFNLESSLARKPKILLVDELAHTNVPGLRHVKRWQDIMDLIEAGISVYTTLNVQHLESLNDVISSITGVEVRETVPDTVLKNADKIELIDIPPDELVTRLKEGKIYPKDKVDAALKNFFHEGNLLALREITLRKAAEKIDAQMLIYREKANIDSIWATHERIIVAIAPNRFARRLVRAAARIATSKHAELIVVFVETPRFQLIKESDKQLVEDAILLAQKLGALVERRSGTDIVQEILEVAISKNATLIVVGKPIRGRFREIFFNTVADDLIRRSGPIDVHLITGESEEATAAPIVISNKKPRLLSLLLTLGIVCGATAISFLLFPYIALTNLIMVYILAAVVVAVLFGRTESIIASILNVIAFDYCFVPPRFSLAVSDFEYVVTFMVMLTTSLLMSTLTLRLKLQSKAVHERERRTQALYEAGRRLVIATEALSIGIALVDTVKFLCKVDACFLFDKGGRLSPSPGSISQFEIQEGDFAVAGVVYEKRKAAGACTDTLPGANGLYLPIYSGDRCYGVLGIEVDPVSFDLSLFPVLELLAQQAALCFERNLFQEESFNSKLTAEKESVRTILLSSISHDLRTPLTVIQGAASTILQGSFDLSEKSKSLVVSIDENATRLSRLVQNVLSLTSLEGKTITPRYEWNSADELISSALDKTEHMLGSRKVTIEVSKECPLVYVDASLIEQVFVNLIENSAVHAPLATELLVKAQKKDSLISFTVSDDGPGFGEESFEGSVLRGDTTRHSGSGLGLLICDAIAQLHHGKFIKRSRKPHGAEFEILIPYQKA